MIHFSPIRSLMQANETEEVEKNLITIGIVGGSILSCICVMIIIARIYNECQKCRLEDQERKYADWTDGDGLLPEFSQLQVKPTRRNPLHIAIQVENMALVRALVGGKVQSCDHVDGLGHYALYYAAQTGSLEMVKYIAKNTPKDFSPEGRTPLHVAAQREDFRMLSYLVQKFPQMQMNKDYGKSYLKELCVTWIGADYPQPCLKSGRKYSEFIHKHKALIPNELLEGLLFPYRDLSKEEVSIEMVSLDQEDESLLTV